jgi:HEAT repeat protein
MLWWTLRKLKAADVETRTRAATALGDRGDRSAVPALIEALSDESEEVRRAAAESLRRIVHPAAAEPLVKALQALAGSRGHPKANSEDFRRLAVAIAGQGKPSVGPLLRLLDSPEKDARLWAAHALGRIGDPEAVTALTRLLEDKRSEVRREAALALGQTRGGSAAEPLIRALSHRDVETRKAAAEGLGALGGARTEAALSRAVTDPEESVQLAVVAGLGRVGTTAAALALRPALDSERRTVREAAAAVLAGFELQPGSAAERAALAVLRADVEGAVREGDAAVEPLVEALSSKDPARRLVGARGLGRLKTARAVPQLLRAVRDLEPGVQAAAADALAAVGQPALDGLLEILSSGDAVSRRYAARAVGAIGDPRSVPALVEAYRDNHRASESYLEPLDSAREALEALTALLASGIGQISENDLELVAGLPDGIQEYPAITADQTYRQEVRIDASALRDRARRALGRQTAPEPPQGPTRS